MEQFDKLVELTKNEGIMLTVRYVVERDAWAMLFHIDKQTSIGAEGGSLEAVCKDVLKQYGLKAV